MRRPLVLALLSCSLLACGEEDATGVDASGVFRLTSVNGAPPPFTLTSDATSRTEITGGALHLGADGTFADTVRVLRTQSNGVAQTFITSSGRYEATSTSVVLRPSDGVSVTINRSPDGTLLRGAEGLALTYAPD